MLIIHIFRFELVDRNASVMRIKFNIINEKK